jgi:hypothetical protein
MLIYIVQEHLDFVCWEEVQKRKAHSVVDGLE